jgi:hypothetical protein
MLDYPHRCPRKPPLSGCHRIFPEDAPQRGTASLTGFSRGHSIPPNPAESRGSARAHHGPDAAAPNCLAPSACPPGASARSPARHGRREQPTGGRCAVAHTSPREAATGLGSAAQGGAPPARRHGPPRHRRWRRAHPRPCSTRLTWPLSTPPRLAVLHSTSPRLAVSEPADAGGTATPPRDPYGRHR